MAVLRHTAHIQILDGDGVEPAREVCCELVQRVLPNIADAGMKASQLYLSLGAIGRAFLLAA